MIHNHSQSRWTFIRVATGCSCVRPKISRPYIDAGGTGSIDISYKAGAKEVDDSRTVDVAFKEGAAPQLRLVTRASIRQPLYANPHTLIYSGVASDERLLSSIHVYNYSATKWSRLVVEPSEKWICCDLRAELKAPATNGRAPSQVWRIAVAVVPCKLTPGMHRASVRLRGGEVERVIPIEIDLVPPVAAIPTQLFFGKGAPGEIIERQVNLVFTEAAAPPDPATIQLEHTLGKDLEVTIKRGHSPRYCCVVARFHPSSTAGSVRSVLHVESGNHKLDIPLIAAVADATHGNALPDNIITEAHEFR